MTVEVSIGWDYNTVIKVTIHTTPKLVGYFKDSKSFRKKVTKPLTMGILTTKRLTGRIKFKTMIKKAQSTNG